MDVQKINESILALLCKHARMMDEFVSLDDDELRRRLNHLSVPLAYREANVSADLDALTREPPGRQQSRLRRRHLRPHVRSLLDAGVRLHVLINALRAELEDLEQIREEEGE